MNLILEFHIIFLSLQIRQTIKNSIQTSEICKELMDKWIFQLMLRPELCLAERVPTSARQNFLYLQTNFGKSSQALALLNMTLLFASASLFTTTNL